MRHNSNPEKMRKLIVIILLILICHSSNELQACTVFMSTNGSRTLIGANEDFKKQDSKLWVIPAKEGRYGHVLFGYDGSLQSGLNDQGLFWDGLRAYPKEKTNQRESQFNIGGNVLYKILEDCASVDEVIHLLKKYYWKGFQIAQLMVVDKSGASAILTYKNNKLTVTQKTHHFQVCTNFRISGIENETDFHWYNIGSSRFKKAKNLLEQPDLSILQAFEILQKTAQNNIFAKTIYSTVVDLNTGDLHISVNANFSRVTKINLFEELQKGKHSYHLSELIQHPTNNRKNIEVHDDEFLTENNGKIYLDKYWKQTSKKSKAKYYRTIEKDTATPAYIMKDYFMDGTRQGIAYYSSLDPEIIDGKYLEFYESGNIKATGQFKNRLKDGPWTYWSLAGKKEKTLSFANGIEQ